MRSAATTSEANGDRDLLGARADDFYGKGGVRTGEEKSVQENEQGSKRERPSRPENRRPFSKHHVAGLYPSGFPLITL